ncbi:MAG TPA: hypothetical protein VFQ54_09780 [Thermomicrobiales bacterium]|nr:hypothetical protein [Thermomicrobiales bacterium]
MPRRLITVARFCFVASLAAVICLGSAGSNALAQDSSSPTPSAGNSELTTELPTVDLPTMNSQGFVFEIQSTFDGTPCGTPANSPIYLMNQQNASVDDAKAIADKLGIKADVTDDGSGTYSAKGNGSLYVTPGLIQYVSGVQSPDGDLPSDQQIIATAREWLRGAGQLPANAGNGSIQTKVASPAQAIVIFQPVTPSPLLSSTPNITVTVGPKNTVLEAAWRWADLKQGDTYQLRPVDQAFGDVTNQIAYLQATLPSDKYPDGTTIKGNVIYAGASVAYASSGVPGEQQYLQPVYVFTGKLTPDGSDTAYPITAYVPALVNSNQPVG